MGRPILEIKNTGTITRRYNAVNAQGGRKAIRDQFGVPFALQTAFASVSPGTRNRVLGELSEGDRFQAQPLQRLSLQAPNLKPKVFVERALAARL